jgi:hypothetical protein
MDSKRNKKSDKAKKNFELNGKNSTRAVRIMEKVREAQDTKKPKK